MDPLDPLPAECNDAQPTSSSERQTSTASANPVTKAPFTLQF